MADTYHAFKQGFLQHLKLAQKMPPFKVAAASIREEAGTFTNTTYGKMLKGAYVQTHYCSAFLAMLARAAKHPRLANHYLRLESWLRLHNVDMPAEAANSIETLLFVTCHGPCHKKPASAPPTEDPLQMAFAIYQGAGGHPSGDSRLYLDSPSRGDTSAHEVLGELGQWLYMEHGCVALGAVNLYSKDARGRAIASGEGRIGLPMAAYCARLMEWHKATCGWGVVRTLVSGKPVGFTVVLPLRTDSYAAIRSGGKNSWECAADDVDYPSTHLFLEAAVTNPLLARSDRRAAEAAMAQAIRMQMAALVRIGRLSTPAEVRFLSLEGTPTNAARLRAQGFVDIERRMAKSGEKLLERIIDRKTWLQSMDEVCALWFYDRLCPPEPPGLARQQGKVTGR